MPTDSDTDRRSQASVPDGAVTVPSGDVAQLATRSVDQPPPATQSRLWTFLNSAFGLLVMSTVLVSGAGGAVINYWLEHQRAESAAAVTIERLDMQISYDISRSLIELRHTALLRGRLRSAQQLQESAQQSTAPLLVFGTIHVNGDKTEPPMIGSPREIFLLKVDRYVSFLKATISASPNAEALLTSPHKFFSPLFPEYANYNVPALVAALHEKVPPDQRAELEDVLAQLASLSTANSDDVAGIIKTKLILRRWRRPPASYFYSCPHSDPLCIYRFTSLPANVREQFRPDELRVEADIIDFDVSPCRP